MKMTTTKTKAPKEAKPRKNTKFNGNSKNHRREDNQYKDEPKKSISITEILLSKTYGPYVPKLADEGGYVIVGADTLYESTTHQFSYTPLCHTWCRWGWDMGAAVRFESMVDARTFAKSLACQNARGRSYDRGINVYIMDTGTDERLEKDDTSLPRPASLNMDTDEDVEDSESDSND